MSLVRNVVPPKVRIKKLGAVHVSETREISEYSVCLSLNSLHSLTPLWERFVAVSATMQDRNSCSFTYHI